MSEKEIIMEFINSDNFMIIDNYISKPYIETIEEQDKEIERLNKALKEYDRETYCKLINENHRLNNVINELEKYINEEYVCDDIGMKIFDATKLQDKLLELKGSE